MPGRSGLRMRHSSAASGPVGFRNPATCPGDDCEVTLRAAPARYFRREFIERLDRTIPFRALGLADYRMLLERHSADIASQFGIELEVAETVKDHLCAHSAAPRGVRVASSACGSGRSCCRCKSIYGPIRKLRQSEYRSTVGHRCCPEV